MIKHLACIMDGNRRWSKKNNCSLDKGYQEGVKAIEKVANFCLKHKIQFLSLYTFSIENESRSDSTKNIIFNNFAKEGKKSLETFLKKKIRIKFLGQRSLFPKKIISTCEMLEKETENLNKLTINSLLFYGARQEIVETTKKIIAKIKLGQLKEKDLSTEVFHNHLWTSSIPDPEIIIRTGGNQRLSNFLLFQAAYSEMYFLDCMWPEITSKHLDRVFAKFKKTKKNFGK